MSTSHERDNNESEVNPQIFTTDRNLFIRTIYEEGYSIKKAYVMFGEQFQSDKMPYQEFYKLYYKIGKSLEAELPIFSNIPVLALTNIFQDAWYV